MSSRKRRISYDHTPQEIPSKRSKLLSTLWRAEEVEGSITKDVAVNTASSHSATQGNRRKVNAVIGENSQEYPIEWEDLLSNRRPKPNWKRKEYIDESAIAAVDHKNLFAEPYQKSTLSEKGRREDSIGPETNPIALIKHIWSSKSTDTQSERVTNPFLENSVETGRDKERTSLVPLIALPSSIAVEISQRSSLDKDQYIRYQSSFSTQDLPLSLPPHQDSGLGDSSPPPEGSVPTQAYQDTIVPDSQSLPGSSSYVPSSSASVNVTSSKGSARESHPACKAQTVTESEADSSSLRDSEVNDTSIPVSTSNFSTSQDRSNLSEPSKSIFQISSTTSGAASLGTANLTRISRTIANSISSITASSARISTQVEPSVIGSSILEVPLSSEQLSYPSQVLGPRQNLQPVTRASSDLESQTTNDSSSAGDWQSGQPIPISADSPSQISSENADKISVSPTRAGDTPGVLQTETSARRRAVFQKPFVISEDQIDDNQTSQTSEESILSQRDPNSQPEKRQRLSQIQEEDFEPDYLEIEDSTDSPPRANSFLPQSPPTPFAVPMDGSTMSEKPTQVSAPPGKPPRDVISSPPTKPLLERLKFMRAANRAKFGTAQASVTDHEDPLRDAASPSPIPPKPDPPVSSEPSRMEVQPLKVVELPLPVRAVQSQPHTPAFPSRLAMSHSFSEQEVSLKPVTLGELEYVISLPMNTRVRDQYVSTINYHRKIIEECIKVEEPDEQLKTSIDRLLFRVNAVTTHIDLDCKPILSNGRLALSEQKESPANEAKWAENCSAKFQFLGHLFEATRESDILIAIFATSDHLLDIIETFLKGKEVKYTKPDAEPRPGPSSSHSEGLATRGKLFVTLLSSTDDTMAVSRRRANLVIAFDGCFNAKSRKVMSFREGRENRTNGVQLAPVIHLLVHGSGEHIERCLPNDLDPWTRKRQLVSYITQTRHRVGQLLPDEIGPRILAEEVAEFIEVGGLDKDWALPGVRAIEDLEIIEPHSLESSSSNTTQPSDSTKTENIMGRTPAAPKRAIDTGAKTSASKKQKNTSAEVTYVSDSIQDTQSTGTNTDEIVKLRRDLREALFDVEAEKTSHRSDRAGMMFRLRDAEDKLNAEKKAHARTEKERQDILSSLNDLQTRMEDKIKDFRTLRHDKEGLESTMTATINKSRLQTSEIAILQERRVQLELDLKTARDANKASSNPNVAELENLREEIHKLKAQNAILEKKVAAHATDLEYTRTQYQTASNAAAEATGRVSELERHLATMTVKASGEAARLAEVNRSSAVEQANAEVERLQLENQMFENMLRRKEEELRELKQHGRGGVVTRGNSVGGKSPRGGSRAGSPAPGTPGFGGKVGGSALRFG